MIVPDLHSAGLVVQMVFSVFVSSPAEAVQLNIETPSNDVNTTPDNADLNFRLANIISPCTNVANPVGIATIP